MDQLQAAQIVECLGGINEAYKSVKMAKVMRTMMIPFTDKSGVSGQIYIDDVETALAKVESIRSE